MNTNRLLVKEFNSGDINISWRDMSFYFRKLLLKEHKDYRERFHLFNYLWSNGLQPYEARKYVMIHKGYDNAAHRQMNDIQKNAEIIDRGGKGSIWFPTVASTKDKGIGMLPGTGDLKRKRFKY